MNNLKTKLVLSLFVLAYATICGLFIHSFLIGESRPLLILLFPLLPLLKRDLQSTHSEANSLHHIFYTYRKPLFWFFLAGFVLTLSIGVFTGQI